MTITSTPQISSIGKVITTNTLHKVGTLTMTNSRALDLGIDPISGEVTIVDGSTGATCTKYTRNTVSGVLCELLEYTFVGEDITGYNPGLALTSSRVNGVLQSHMNGGTGLAAEITFDESNWYSISRRHPERHSRAGEYLPRGAAKKRRQGVPENLPPEGADFGAWRRRGMATI
ncbi:Uncharacterised protein [Enterobacter cloacae]|uniref:Uncharacterized protein n=1 Tax=Enterobacter cloacae TaxID=550 RepID=A0A377LP02_ENTCL|nr:Uncharacterised protein [Enterobacter cloacae]